jgi:hypothetical protein
MVEGPAELQVPDSRIYTDTQWVRVPVGAGGFFFPSVKLGDTVEPDQVIGTIIDPLTDRHTVIRASEEGEIIGLAAAQIVLSGYALVHLGVSHR